MLNFIALSLTRIKRTFLVFLTPGCLLGPAVWLSDSQSARIHQRVCLRSHPSLSKTTSWMVLFIKTVLWFTSLVWISLISALLIAHKTPFKGHIASQPDTALNRLRSFIYLGFWLGAKPQTYFRLKLYASPRTQWLQYAFPQEQSKWHMALGYENEQVAKVALADKQITERCLNNANVACIKSNSQLAKGQTVDTNLIFTKQPAFIKPNSLNAMRGCARLLYHADSTKHGTHYHLIGRDLLLNHISLKGEQLILTHLQRLTNKVDLLIQPLLVDHPDLRHYSDERDISTVRVITCLHNAQYHVVHALLEVALKNSEHWGRYGVDLSTGRLNLSPTLPNDAEFRVDFHLPFWQQVRRTVLSAHQSMGQIKTVSWDVCIQPNGPIIIEGNSGWGVSAPQTTCLSPLLQGTLSKAYASNQKT